MIKSIHLQNFFGFQDCTINLEKGENVLVGINGSGKSNFFKALRLLIAIEHPQSFYYIALSEYGGYDGMSNLQRSEYDPIELTFIFDSANILAGKSKGELIYHFTLNKVAGNASYTITESLSLKKGGSNPKILLSFKDGNGKLIKEDEKEYDSHKNFVDRVPAISKLYSNKTGSPLERIKYFIEQIVFYEQFSTNRYSPIRNSKATILADRLSYDGGNLSSLLQTMKATDRKTYSVISDALSKVNDKFIDFDFIPTGSGNTELQIREQNFIRPTPIHLISDGTLRFLCLMSILYNPNRGTVVCIDEPELGLHPDMINTLYRAIEHAAETSQVIISTHSPHLLDYFNLSNIHVFEKNEENATVVKRYADSDFKGWYETFYPGQMWRAGDIGGNRW